MALEFYVILVLILSIAVSRVDCQLGGPAPVEPGGGIKAACINGADFVRTPNGQKRIDQLIIGDQVAVGKNGNNFLYEPIITFLHRDASKDALGFRFILSSGRNVTLSDEHLIFIAPNKKALLAKNVQTGNAFYLGNQSIDTVNKIERTALEGRYSPLTESGVILVNDILVSCYSQIEDHDLMHRTVHWLLPFTKSDTFFGSQGFFGGGDGVHAVGNAMWHFFRHYLIAAF